MEVYKGELCIEIVLLKELLNSITLRIKGNFVFEIVLSKEFK